MKKIYYLITLLGVLVSLAACNNDTDLDPRSIFPDGVDKATQNDFDRWVLTNYTYPYNIQFEYRYSDKEAHVEYDVVPAEYDKSIAVAKLVKHLWVDAYNELVGRDFLRQYSPRMIQLIGSAEYKEDGSEVLGTAEGGMKIFLNKVNLLDIENPDLEIIKFYFIKTMYHEFGHILQQTKNYSTDFNAISTDYQGPSWVNVGDYENSGSTEALEMGFISAYASSEAGEDFVEILSFYVVYGKEYWENMLSLAGESGATKMLLKYALIKDYLDIKWGIDIEKLEQIVQRRMGEISELNLESLD
ncbi:zinc-binding metallopeptidase [Bacteroides reticulotermitis]|uniref:Substrate import-associated zinc metallohydrolase lipoprotein n=2 Tax=Bacteroides reticulotermitis TaxID=1133319 RepID=W4V0D2_9BACE|nr:putative zinc-binding metallopeptidase [Bacteroides reticulotermitis]MBB4044135.1 substrate import-associated zinc metallohydrolase lipoprotein [Bacteroides reticulotermitis]GAE86199.1 hypothetical protein JCM10512_4694 [Bacteroides reticulotermitis JCM 10512]